MRFSIPIFRSKRETRVLGVILLLGLVHGLVYIFSVPLWQHYDEPAHFEYAWLIANRGSLPELGDYDQGMRREVAVSMLKHGFFEGLGFQPNLDSQDEPIWISPWTKLDDPPLYYLLSSVPLRLLRSCNIDLQLYAARLVSLFLYLISILAAWGVMTEFTPESHSLRWMVPATLVLLPGFTDLMTALNSDVGATAVFSVFLWGVVRLVRRGFSGPNFLWAVGAAVLCILTKGTVLVALPLLILSLLLAVLRGGRRRLVWGLLLAGFLAGLVAVFSWGDAALWYRRVDQGTPTRSTISDAPHGEHAIKLEIQPNIPPPAVFQLLPWRQMLSLRGKALTVGAWIWATRPMKVLTPILNDERRSSYELVEVGTAPTFFSLSVILAEDAGRVRVELAPFTNPEETPATVFYDGLVLVEGTQPTGELPFFIDPQGGEGVWGGEPFNNLLRNASAERAWPWVRTWANEMGTSFVPGKPSTVLASLLDWPGAGWYYQATGQNLLRTFWAKFGWGNVPLLGHKPYRSLAVVTLVGLVGAGLALWRERRVLPWGIVVVMAVALLGTWGPALIRGVESLIWVNWTFIPGARYGYPSIIPTALVFNLGWLEVLKLAGRRLGVPAKAQFVVYFVAFFALDAIALLSLFRFFHTE